MDATDNSGPPDRATKREAWVDAVRRHVDSLRYGEVQFVVHEGRVVQIERT